MVPRREMADRAGGIKAGKSRRRVGVMKSLRIYSIAGGMKPSRARRQRLAGEAPPLHLLDGVFHLGFLLNFAHYLNVRLIGDRRTDKFANQARPVCYQHSDGIHSAPAQIKRQRRSMAMLRLVRQVQSRPKRLSRISGTRS